MKLDKSTQITLIIVVGVIIVALIASNFSKSGYENTISVSGQASIEVMPDLIGTYFLIETTGTTSSDAASQSSVIYDSLVASLIADGFTEEEIQTQSYSVSPEYDWRTGKTTGNYKASHSVKVEISSEDYSRIAEVLDAGINAGAGVSYINFELSQESQNQYKAEAMKLAAQDATTKAEAVAQGLQKKLGSLVSVNVDSYNYYPWLAYDASGVSTAEVREAAPSIVPNEQEISASVTAVYKIR